MPTNTKIEDLPDFPAIQQIRKALWGTAETRGAAVLVGAGFSRNAVLPALNSSKPPLWTDFQRVMKERIYPVGGNAPSDALKLAEEYRALLGPSALESLIRALVRDDEWLPGRLHERLVSLPWTDILTTNWDTLLERAAETSIQQTYDTVRAMADIPRTRSPRIVKLHGSLPSNRPFIFTEEDYRKYPKDFAPFVNLVQQVLMENELCLIGFSGDDPNFLQWSGWIRDQLGDAARPIYLIGVLTLSPARRKVLEARRVFPIDLAPLVEDVDESERHSAASDRFLDFLASAKPKPAGDWLSEASSPPPTIWSGDPASSTVVAYLKTTIARWRSEREAYPGWLVCPSSDRAIIRRELIEARYLGRAVEELPGPERTEALYETARRFDWAFLPIDQWLRDALAATVGMDPSNLNRRQRCEIAAILARTAREQRDRAMFDRSAALLEEYGGSDKDIIAVGAYEKSLWARDNLDYQSLAVMLPTITGEDPAWKIKRAALYWDLGESETADRLAIEAVREARERYLRDRKSIWNISRLAWALFLARAGRSVFIQPAPTEPLIALTEWPQYQTTDKVDPWNELDELDRELDEAFRIRVESSRNERPRFDAGAYSTGITLTSSLENAKYDTLRLAETVGLPAQAGPVNVLGSRLLRGLELSDDWSEDDMLVGIRILGSSDKLIERMFGRIEAARIPLPTVEKLIEVLRRAITFGRPRFTKIDNAGRLINDQVWVDRVRALVEILSRLEVRLTGKKAIAAFREAVDLAKAPDWRHWLLFEPLRHLLERSCAAVSPLDRSGLVTEILNVPLPDERGIQAQAGAAGPEREWPEITPQLPKTIRRPSDEAGFASRVSVLISKVSTGDLFTRERAIIRLACLYRRADVLTEEEVKLFREGLWSKRDPSSALPLGFSRLPDIFFELPADKEELTRLFRNILTKESAGPISLELLRTITYATRIRKDGSRAFELTADEAIRLFDLIVAWQPISGDIDLFGSNANAEGINGAALAEGVLPFVDLTSLGNERVQKLLNTIEKGLLNSAVISLPQIVRLDQSYERTAAELTYKAAFARQAGLQTYGLRAINLWRLLSTTGVVGKVPQKLRQAVLAIVTSARDPGLFNALAIATRFVGDGEFDDEDKRALADALDRFRVETDYASWDTNDRRTTTLTLVRANCVRLAEKLRHSGTNHEAITWWVESTRDDPVPEVRYALDRSEE